MTETFQLSLFKNKKDNQPRVVSRSWQELCERFQKPPIRKEKDGLLFSPALFEPARRLKENVKEISLLCLDVDHDADFETAKKFLDLLGCAYAIYSTHSHLRKTDSNPNGEPRYRVVVPLACPIPSNEFPSLWRYAKYQTRMPFDENAKDSSRIFYTPVKAETTAPYEFFFKEGAFLDWRKLPLHSFTDGEKPLNAETTDGINQNGDRQKSNLTEYAFHDDRHAELCRRIEARAKATGRGTFEMKCPAHNGKGDTSLFYDPTGKSVACLKKPNPCSYFEILSAFGLPDRKLPSREHAGKDSNSNYSQEKKPLKRLKTVRMSDIEAKPVEWLWQDFIPRGALTILEGEEELGKTWIVCALAGATGQGYGLPNNPQTEPANVLMMSAEDSLTYVIKPRLEAVKAPCERIIAIDEHFTFDRDGILRLEFELAEHKPKLSVIDPLFSFTGSINLNNDNEIRSVTDELSRLAEKYNCAIVAIRHIGKSKGMGDPRNAGLNGIGWRASARVVLLVGKDPNDERQRAIVQTKNNLAPKYKKAIGYEIIGNEFFWKDSSLTARKMLSLQKNEEDRDDQNEAAAFLREALRDGKRQAGEVTAEAEKLGISKQNLRTARHKLGIEPKSVGFGKDKQWLWEIPKNVCLSVETTSVDVDRKQNQHLSANDGYKTSYDNNLPLDVDADANQRLSVNNQHLSEASNDNFIKNYCQDCEKELNKTPGGEMFCPVCLTTY